MPFKKKKRWLVLPEGGVFAIPLSGGRAVFAQLWTLDRDGIIGHCGITGIVVKDRTRVPAVDWSDRGIYIADICLIIDHEWLQTGWPVVRGFAPARVPLRDESGFWRGLAYSLWGWRPQINTFVLFESAAGVVEEALEGKVTGSTDH